MRYVRIYADEAGESHFADVEVSFVPANYAPPAPPLYVSAPTPASAFVWTFKAPEAELLNERGEVVGKHFTGPTWQGQDGTTVVGAVLERADAPDPGAIPWLLIEAKEHTGSGAFSPITHIQRLANRRRHCPERGL